MDANVHTLVTHITCNDVPGFSDNIRNHFGCARDDTAQAINFFRITMASGDIEKAKVKLSARKYNPATRKHEKFVEKKLPPHSK